MATQPKLVNKQFNTPIGLYSEQNVKEVLQREQQMLSNGAVGIDFHNPGVGKPAHLQSSAVLRMLEEEEHRRGGRAGNSDYYPRPLRDVSWPPPDYDQATQVRSSFKDVVTPGVKRVAWPPPQEGVLDPAEAVQSNVVQHQGGPQNYNQPNSYSPQQAAPHHQPPPTSYRPLKPLDVSSVGTGSPLASPALNQSPQAFRSSTPSKGWAPVQSPVGTPSAGYHITQPQYQPVTQPYQQVSSQQYHQQSQYQHSSQQYHQQAASQQFQQASQPQYQQAAPKQYQPSSPQPQYQQAAPKQYQPSSPQPQYQQAAPKQYQPSSPQPQYQQAAPQQYQQAPAHHQPQYQQAPDPQQYQSQSFAQPPVAAQNQVAAPQPQPSAKHFEPPPSTITLRPQAPVSQSPAPVYSAQPATASLKGGKNLRGDLKWPPEKVKSQMEEENQQRIELARGPAFRPKRKDKDYTGFFAQHALNSTYPGYKIPPGTQYYRPE